MSWLGVPRGRQWRSAGDGRTVRTSIINTPLQSSFVVVVDECFVEEMSVDHCVVERIPRCLEGGGDAALRIRGWVIALDKKGYHKEMRKSTCTVKSCEKF